jgi:heme exporter protein D
MPFGSPASRKLLLTMVLLVVGLDGLAVGVYYGFDIGRRANQVQMAFVVVWTMLTLAVVLVLLHRIRLLRDVATGRRRRTRAAP